eukprot:scaffold1084_cov47-Phaeocystis_antarctica.AAC.3
MIANGARIDGIELGYNRLYGHACHPICDPGCNPMRSTQTGNPMRSRLQPCVVQVQPDVHHLLLMTYYSLLATYQVQPDVHARWRRERARLPCHTRPEAGGDHTVRYLVITHAT